MLLPPSSTTTHNFLKFKAKESPGSFPLLSMHGDGNILRFDADFLVQIFPKEGELTQSNLPISVKSPHDPLHPGADLQCFLDYIKEPCSIKGHYCKHKKGN